METIYNASATDFEMQVQAMLLMKAFDDICDKAKGKIRIVPLKGIDLVRFLYADTLDRELKDIDLLVMPAEKSGAGTPSSSRAHLNTLSPSQGIIELLQNDGYRPEFSFALDETALKKKKKVSMLSNSDRKPNVDVHLALITKKFFSTTINGFNDDAISRTKAVDEVVSVLDGTDRWLYLASHLTFHFLHGEKWFRDLILLMDRFDEAEMALLVERTKQYNFERIVSAVYSRMISIYPKIAGRIDMQQLLPDRGGKRFLRYMEYLEAHPKKIGRGLRLARYYWEFVFISKKSQRRRCFMRLIFPSLGDLQNIYRCHAAVALLLYLPNMLINALGVLLFSAQYLAFSTLLSKQIHAK